MDTSSPWTGGVLANKQNTLGYSYQICIRCSNGWQTTDLDYWLISQSQDCSPTLSTPPTPTSVYLAYIMGASDEAVTPTPTFTTWDALFSNSYTAGCPITSC
jgi:hypothetical protein